MLKKLLIGLSILAGLAGPAQAAGTVPGFSLAQVQDSDGTPLIGCKAYIIQAGTTSTPQNAYSDAALTLPLPNPLTCDGYGRLPQFFVADGSIKIRLTKASGVQVFIQDGLLVVGASSGGGGGSPVDPTTIIATGDMKARYGTGAITGFVRANGRTIGSATSGASERANADCQSLFEYLWGADANLAVSTGRGASANADWVANKTITLPDWRGRALAFLDDMGNSAAGRLTSTYFGTSATALGAAGGLESQTLALGELPTGITAVNNTQAINVSPSPSTLFPMYATTSPSNFSAQAGSQVFAAIPGAGSVIQILNPGTITNAISVTSNNTNGNPHRIVQPTMLATIYLKL